MKKKLSITIDETLLSKIDSIIDNIYIRNRSQAIEYLTSQSIVESRTAIILAGGNEENRKIKSKYRFEYTIANIVKKLKANSFNQIYIVAQAKALTKAFDIMKDGSEFGVEVHYIEEKKSLGSFSSLKLLKGTISSKFLCVFCDLNIDKINLEALWNDHILNKGVCTLIVTTSKNPNQKGTLKVEGNTILEFTQKPKHSDIHLVFSPIFVCEQEIFNFSGKSLEGELFPVLAKKGFLKGHLSGEKEEHIHSEKDLQRTG